MPNAFSTVSHTNRMAIIRHSETQYSNWLLQHVSIRVINRKYNYTFTQPHTTLTPHTIHFKAIDKPKAAQVNPKSNQVSPNLTPTQPGAAQVSLMSTPSKPK